MAIYVSRYAHAFNDVVNSAKLDATALDAQFSDFLATWDGSVELRNFFENPSIPSTEKVGILDKLNEKLKLTKELRNLIAVLISNDRIAQVSEVAEAWRALLMQQMGIRSAEIVTARKPSTQKNKRPWWPTSQTWPDRRSTPASSSTHRSSAAQSSASAAPSTTAPSAAASNV